MDDEEERKRSEIRSKLTSITQADGFVGRFCEEKEEEQQFEGEGVKERVHVLGDVVARCLRRMFHEEDGDEKGIHHGRGLPRILRKRGLGRDCSA